MSLSEREIQACIETVEEMRAVYVPNPKTRGRPGGSTGNMAFNALRYRAENGAFILYVDESIAPYAPITNAVWAHKLIRMGNFIKGETVTRFRTWDNPNAGWWRRFWREFAARLALKLHGAIVM